jgi:colanic acid/amylovoran biosynthesis protein
MAHTLGPSSHEDDRIAIKDVSDALPKDLRTKTSYIEDFDLTCKDVEKIYSYYDFMVGTRFHSVIFALNVNVPSIAIAYGGNKGKGIMNVLGNDDYSIGMDTIDEASLISVFDKLENNREKYLLNLKGKKVEIQRQRDDLIIRIREILGLK